MILRSTPKDREEVMFTIREGLTAGYLTVEKCADGCCAEPQHPDMKYLAAFQGYHDAVAEWMSSLPKPPEEPKPN